MVDFDHFVKDLGPHAKHYTPAELKELYVEVRRLAEILLEKHRVRLAAEAGGRSPQTTLDGPDRDRTIESVLIEPVDGPDPPQADDS